MPVALFHARIVVVRNATLLGLKAPGDPIMVPAPAPQADSSSASAAEPSAVCRFIKPRSPLVSFGLFSWRDARDLRTLLTGKATEGLD